MTRFRITLSRSPARITQGASGTAMTADSGGYRTADAGQSQRANSGERHTETAPGGRTSSTVTRKPDDGATASRSAEQRFSEKQFGADPVSQQFFGVVPASEQGLADEMKQLRELLRQVADSVHAQEEQHRQSLSELQHATVELAVAAASWLTGTAIAADQFAVDDLIRDAVHRLEGDEPIRVRLNPADHALLNRLMADSPDAVLLDQISCVDDPELPRGACRLDSGRRTLLSDLETRLEEVRRLWMENLDETQIERRGDGTNGRSLRRFPDRRETA